MRMNHVTKFTVVFALLFSSVAAFGQATGIQEIAAQAALVSEFDVNGLKVILKRRPGAATVAGGLFIRGGARNITDKNAGIEALMIATAIEEGKANPRRTARR